MSDPVEFPDDGRSDRRTVTDGFFEREVQLSRAETAAFLRDLADQIEAESRLTISTSEWQIPFAFGEPIEVEVEFTGGRRDELEVEVEFEESGDGDGLDVS
jgi:amphi-Trp domain-containing protein